MIITRITITSCARSIYITRLQEIQKNHSWDIGSIHNEYSIILFKKSPKFKRERECEREMDRCKRNWYERGVDKRKRKM